MSIQIFCEQTKISFHRKINLLSFSIFCQFVIVFVFVIVITPPPSFVIVIVIVFVITHPPSFPSFIPFFSSAFHVSRFTNPLYILLIYLYL